MLNPPTLSNTIHLTRHRINQIREHITDLLVQIENARTGDEKKALAVELFDYVVNTQTLYFNHRYKIRMVVERKLRQLYWQEHWVPANGYYLKLFGSSIAPLFPQGVAAPAATA